MTNSEAVAVNAATAEQPWPVRVVAAKIAEWINRLGTIWVEGQVTQISARPGTGTAFLTLRDPTADISVTVTCPVRLVQDMPTELTEGSQVIVHGKPRFYAARGTLSLWVDEIRAVGIGELLARIERLRRVLAGEGLFDPRRKRPIPFLPTTVGLITGRASAAEHDVVTNARARWPSVRFRIINVAVQGVLAVGQVVDALSTLDKDESVDVIVVARGGGSVEDLLPFSDETLCRAVSDCKTPVISAIGHEPDTPLLDHVADVRCSTPTDAGKRVVPDMAEETQRIHQLRDRARRALHGWVDRERKLLDSLRSRPVLAEPLAPIDRQSEQLAVGKERMRRAILARLSGEETAMAATRSCLATLGPAATLARGYAVVQQINDDKPTVLTSTSQTHANARLRIRLADGAIAAVVSEPPTGEAK